MLTFVPSAYVLFFGNENSKLEKAHDITVL